MTSIDGWVRILLQSPKTLYQLEGLRWIPRKDYFPQEKKSNGQTRKDLFNVVLDEFFQKILELHRSDFMSIQNVIDSKEFKELFPEDLKNYIKDEDALQKYNTRKLYLDYFTRDLAEQQKIQETLLKQITHSKISPHPQESRMVFIKKRSLLVCFRIS